MRIRLKSDIFSKVVPMCDILTKSLLNLEGDLKRVKFHTAGTAGAGLAIFRVEFDVNDLFAMTIIYRKPLAAGLTFRDGTDGSVTLLNPDLTQDLNHWHFSQEAWCCVIVDG